MSFFEMLEGEIQEYANFLDKQDIEIPPELIAADLKHIIQRNREKLEEAREQTICDGEDLTVPF